MRFLALALWLLLCAPAHAQYNCGIGLANTLGIPGLSCQTSLDYSLLGPTLQSGFVFSRASSKTCWNGTALVTVGSGVPCFEAAGGPLGGYGLLLEGQSTNGIRNNTMVGAIIGTPGTNPTYWALDNGAVTHSVVAIGVNSGVNTIDYNWTSASSDGSYNNLPEQITANPSVQGDVWTFSIWVALSGGSLANFSSIKLTFYEYNSSSAQVNSQLGSNIYSQIAGNLVRFSATFTVANAATAYVMPNFRMEFGTGNAINVTMRLGMPQFEKLAFATSVIATSGSAVTRAADALSLPLSAVPWLSPTKASAQIWFDVPQSLSGGQRLFSAAQDTNNMLEAYFIGSNAVQLETRIGGVSNTVATAASAVVPGVQNRLSLAWTSTGASMKVNGGSVYSVSATSPPMNALRFGSSVFSSAEMEGHIQRVVLGNGGLVP